MPLLAGTAQMKVCVSLCVDVEPNKDTLNQIFPIAEGVGLFFFNYNSTYKERKGKRI